MGVGVLVVFACAIPAKILANKNKAKKNKPLVTLTKAAVKGRRTLPRRRSMMVGPIC
ncbi:hypothetical protein WDW86_04950 [Bdellovibrionota bacterium FG-2]